MAFIAGVIPVVCGLLAVEAPFVAGLSITIMVGVLLTIGGVALRLPLFQGCMGCWSSVWNKRV
jgi:uncharacterized membrane protein HdeD (DUF308 family)